MDTREGKISAARMLERFLFAGEDQYGLIGKLSGGEKRRLYLCKVLMEAPNVLILDEPTNDLDISTLQILENYLDDFQGIVIVVSHDRYFLDRTVRRIFAFEEGGSLYQSEGGYTDYVNHKAEKEAFSEEKTVKVNDVAEVPKTDRNNWNAGRQRKLKFTFQEQRDYDIIEEEIATLEEKIQKIESEIPKFSRDFVRLNELMGEKELLEAELEAKMDRWMYLEDLAARINSGE